MSEPFTIGGTVAFFEASMAPGDQLHIRFGKAETPSIGQNYMMAPDHVTRLRDWLTEQLGPIKPPVQECVCGRPDDADEPEDESVAHEAAWQAGYVAALKAVAIKTDADEDATELNTVQNLRVWGIDQSTELEADLKIDDAAKMVAFVLHGTPAA